MTHLRYIVAAYTIAAGLPLVLSLDVLLRTRSARRRLNAIDPRRDRGAVDSSRVRGAVDSSCDRRRP